MSNSLQEKPLVMISLNELIRLARPIVRWWWIIPIAVALSSGVAFAISRTETRYYIARATLMIGNTLESQRPDPIQLQLGSSLGRFYGELAKRERILRPVQEKLNLPFSWDVIANYMLRTSVVPSANLLEIYVTDSNPVRAAAIANSIADQLIAYSPTSPDKIAAEQMTIEQQLRESEVRLNDLRVRIEETTLRRQQVVSASDLAEINQTLMQLEASLSKEQETYNRLLSYKNSSVVNVLTPFEPAEPLGSPLPSRRNLTILFAGLGGFAIAVAAAYVLDRIDPRLRDPGDIRDRLDLSVLGSVPKGLPLQFVPEAVAERRLEAMRQVQTNLMLVAREEGVRALLVTGTQPNEARSAVSVDLADLFARSGYRVLLVDAEPTQPHLTRLFNAEADPGRPWTKLGAGDRQELRARLLPSAIQNVAFLPAAPTLNAQPAILSSRRWHELTHLFGSIADVVIFDGPAVMTGPDAALLAPHVDGVVIVIDPAVDEQDMIAQSRQRLQKDQRTHLMGAVLLEPSALDSTRYPLIGAWPWHRRPALPDLSGNGAAVTACTGKPHRDGWSPAPQTSVVSDIDTSQSPEADRIIITPPPDNDVPHNEERRVIVPPPEAVARMSDETDAALVGQVDQSQDVRVLERSVNDQEMPESGAPLYPERVPSDQQPGLSRRSDMSREAKAPSSTAKARRSGRARNRRHSKKP